MRPTAMFVLAALLVSGSVLAKGQRKVLTGDSEAVQIMLPQGKVTVSYVEAAEGMMVYVESQGVTVKSRTVSLGDGQVAVRFEARHDGFYTPDGKRNVAALSYEPGATIQVTKDNRQAWAHQAGAVYVLTPDITFKEK